jgi:hemerythrin
MPYMMWSKDFEFGIKQIDDQHKKLLETINLLFDSIQSNEGASALDKVLENLVEYVTVHFKTEENLMTGMSFPGYEEHKSIHEKFTKDVMAFKAKHDAGKEPITLSLIEFLVSWLHDHLMNTDIKYAQFYKQIYKT